MKTKNKHLKRTNILNIRNQPITNHKSYSHHLIYVDTLKTMGQTNLEKIEFLIKLNGSVL